ncbi:MAG: hypothetical protein V2I33_01665, partial [Kangiellaceae bacterium]|nr:hypothetical protein [Kangiellaceae bacterium]
DLVVLNLSTNRCLKQSHKFWNGNSLIISRWFNGENCQESELLINLLRDGEQRTLKVSNIDNDTQVISDVIVTKDEDLINMLS